MKSRDNLISVCDEQTIELHHSASQAYEISSAVVDALIAQLIDLKCQHVRLAVEHPYDWRFPGDLMAVQTLLTQAIRQIEPN